MAQTAMVRAIHRCDDECKNYDSDNRSPLFREQMEDAMQ
jgi:hypothetical protein